MVVTGNWLNLRQRSFLIEKEHLNSHYYTLIMNKIEGGREGRKEGGGLGGEFGNRAYLWKNLGHAPVK